MAWLSRVNFISSDTLSFTDVNNLGNDIRAWGGNVNGGGYTLSNVVLSASAGTMATVIGGTGTTSTLTLRSTSGVGTTGADIIFQTGNNGATEVMRLQNGGNVGIGITPVQPFHVYRTTVDSIGTFQGLTTAVGGTGKGGIQLDVNGNGGYALLCNATSGTRSFTISGNNGYGSAMTEFMRIDSSGNVGIGTSSPAYQLQLSTDSAAKPTTNTWTIASDARLKAVKGEYQKGLAEICQVRPVSYEYNGKAGFIADGKDKVSILAQELMQVFPECVDTFKGKLEEDGPELDLYNYNGHAITFALINAIKELKAKIDILEARN